MFPPPIPGTISTGLIFPSTYMWAQTLYYIYPPTPFPTSSPLPLVPTPSGKTCSALLDLYFSPYMKINSKWINDSNAWP
jgi:hypothetical protein